MLMLKEGFRVSFTAKRNRLRRLLEETRCITGYGLQVVLQEAKLFHNNMSFFYKKKKKKKNKKAQKFYSDYIRVGSFLYCGYYGYYDVIMYLSQTCININRSQ